MTPRSFSRNIVVSRDVPFPSDEALVAEAKQGNHAALSELWRRHTATNWNCIWRITRNRQDTEDALQDACLKSFLHLSKFDGRSKFSTWLTRIAINSALMILRKRRNYSEISIDSPDSATSGKHWDLPDKSVDIEGQYVQSQRSERLRTAVSRLRPTLRHVLEIQQHHDGSINDVADRAGLSVAATKSRLLRARTALRRSLDHTHFKPSRSSMGKH